MPRPAPDATQPPRPQPLPAEDSAEPGFGDPFQAALCAALSACLGAMLLLAACGGSGSGTAADTGTVATTPVVAAPVITSQPMSVTATAGTSLTLSVTATGTGLAYQWAKAGTAISGATAASYTLAAPTVADSGAYTVTVSNTAGSITSSTAVVTVTAASSGSTSEQWTLNTGANPADLHEGLSFQRVEIALGTRAVSTSASGLSVRSTGTGSAVVQAGSDIVTVSEDSLGLVITATPPAGTLIEYALSGSYGKTVTVYSSSAYKLSLEGTTIASSDGPALNLQSKQRAYVVLASGSANVLSDSSTYSSRTLPEGSSMDLKSTFFGEGPIILSGGGSLAVTATSKHALASDRHVRLRSGNVTLRALAKDGLRANNAVVVDGGTLGITTPAGKGLKVEGKEDTVQALGFIAINGGDISITSHDKAITASWEGAEDGDTTTLADDPDPRVTINGGTINITTTGTPFEDRDLSDGDSSLSPEGLEAKSVLTITGGTVTIRSTDDALNAGSAIVISGGRILAEASQNDAIDSNGTITITGGVVVANGAGGAEGGLDCDSATFTVTGGTFIGFGGRNSTPTRAVTTQNTVVLRNQAAGLLVLRESSGAAAFAYTLPKSATAVLLGAPGLTTGRSYTVVNGGTLAGTSDVFNGLMVGSGTHSGGTAGTTFTISSTVSQP